jgi:RNA polymerase sigma-70 factor (ECF subfamily)
MSLASGHGEFEALLTPILTPAFGTALHLARNRDDAEDLVQEAALRAFRSFHTFQKGTNFKAWFFRILTNQFLYRYRQKQRQPQMTDLEDASDLYMYSQTGQAGLHQRSSDPAALVLERLSAEEIAQAVQALPDEYRLVATLYFMEEFSYEQIAEIVERPIGTVRSRLHRARKLLQKALWKTVTDAGILEEITKERAD